MSGYLLPSFHSDLANTLFREILFQRSNYYYFLGRVQAWGNPDQPTTDQLTTEFEETVIRSNAVYIEKVASTEVSLATVRYDWTSQTVYDKWDDRKAMSTRPFFVVTDDYNVYKCLDNKAGSQSTVKPTGRTSNPFRTTDGYLWKYMFNIPPFKRTKFSTATAIPVQQALTDSFYNNGSIEDVVITDPGTGYTDTLLTTINVSGTSPGSGATATITTNGAGVITAATVGLGGSGYANSVKIKVNSITGFGAVLQGTVVAGELTAISVISGGSGYLNTDTVTISVGGAILIPGISRVTGSIEKVIIKDPGAGYSGSVTLTISSIGGSGKYGNPAAILKAIVYQGVIQRVTIEDPGVGYPYDAQTDIVVIGDGTGASFSPVIYNGELIDVVVDSPGEGYTAVSLRVVGDGTGATLLGVIQSSDFESDQAIIEQTAVSGAIYAIEVTNQGDFYSGETLVTITGDGTGAFATATVESGKITHVTMTAYGSGYTNATVTFTDPTRSYLGTDKTATAYAILPPSGGHGFDAPSELYANSLSLNISLRNKLDISGLNQDFRQIGLIKNPTLVSSSKQFTDQKALLSKTVQFSHVNSLARDEILLFQGTKFLVVDIDGTTVKLLQLGNKEVIPTGVLTVESEPTRSYTCTSVTYTPSVNRFTGKLLFVSNEPAFTSTEEQGISIKTFFTF